MRMGDMDPGGKDLLIMPTSGGRKDPAGWLMRIRTLGPGAMLRPQRGKDKRRKTPPPRDRRESPGKRVPGATMEAEVRKRVAKAIAALVEAYPFGLLAARVAEQDVDLLVKCPSTDLPLIADLVKKRLMGTIRDAGLGGRFWRKGFLRRALGSEGELRRALVLFRRDARQRRAELVDRVRDDEKLGIRTRRPERPIE